MSTEPGLSTERALMKKHDGLLVGMDEVGRGALAGPVTVGGIRIRQECDAAPVGVNDSKKLSARSREGLAPRIEKWADAWAIVHIPAVVIDDIGIMAALTIGAREVAAALLPTGMGVVLLDGNRDFVSEVGAAHPLQRWVVVTEKKADETCASVAAASILAKVARDAVMVQLHAHAPEYGWQSNKGYGSAAHRIAIRASGSTSWHRRTWRLLSD